MEIKKSIKRWVSNKAEECKAVSPLFSYALDRKLTLLERFRIRFHLLTCNACTNYVANLSFLRDAVVVQGSKIESDAISIPLKADAKDRLKAALRSKSDLE